MAIPNFNSNGILPEGIYEATLEEIKDFFCSYGDKERRKNLLNSLCKYIEDVKKAKEAYDTLSEEEKNTIVTEVQVQNLLLKLRGMH